MNKKLLQYILIGAVVLIWSIILINIYAGVSGAKIQSYPTKIVKQVAARSESSFTLKEDYPDPFIPADSLNELIIMPKAIVPPAGPFISRDSALKVQVHKMILLSGTIGSSASKNLIGMISINGINHIVKQGEEIEGFTIKSIERKKIEVIYENKKFTIRQTE